MTNVSVCAQASKAFLRPTLADPPVRVTLADDPVCIYELKQKVLLKRFCISENQSLDGTQDKLNSRFMTEVWAPCARLLLTHCLHLLGLWNFRAIAPSLLHALAWSSLAWCSALPWLLAFPWLFGISLHVPPCHPCPLLGLGFSCILAATRCARTAPGPAHAAAPVPPAQGGSLNQIQDYSDEDVQERLDLSMPGATKGDLSSRRTRPEVRTKHLRFSPTGRAWAAASTEGLLIYSLDDR